MYQNISGIPISATYAAPNAAISPSLGRNLGSCRGAATCTASLNLELVQPGTNYEDRLQQVDFRFSKRFVFGRLNARANLDLSNIFNASNVYTTNTGFSTVNSQWLVPYEVMGGRLARISGQIDF